MTRSYVVPRQCIKIDPTDLGASFIRILEALEPENGTRATGEALDAMSKAVEPRMVPAIQCVRRMVTMSLVMLRNAASRSSLVLLSR